MILPRPHSVASFAHHGDNADESKANKFLKRMISFTDVPSVRLRSIEIYDWDPLTKEDTKELSELTNSMHQAVASLLV